MLNEPAETSDADAHPSSAARRRPVPKWVVDEPPWVIRELVLASLLVLLGVVAASMLDDRRSEREQAEELERAAQAGAFGNLRFVRERSTSPGGAKPFQSLDLRGLDLIGLDLTQAQLASADLTGANLSGSDLRDADMFGAMISGAGLCAIDGRDAFFAHARAEGADFSGANMLGAAFLDADLLRADFLFAELTSASFGGADLEAASLRYVFLPEEEGSEIPLENPSLRNADHVGANLRNADLRGADLRGVDLSNASLQGADLTDGCWSTTDDARTQYFDERTTWPTGFVPPSTGFALCQELPEDYDPPPRGSGLDGLQLTDSDTGQAAAQLLLGALRILAFQALLVRAPVARAGSSAPSRVADSAWEGIPCPARVDALAQ